MFKPCVITVVGKGRHRSLGIGLYLSGIQKAGRRAMNLKEALQEIKEYTGDRDKVLKHGSVVQIAERPITEKVIHTSIRWGYKFEETESAIYVTKHTDFTSPFERVPAQREKGDE